MIIPAIIATPPFTYGDILDVPTPLIIEVSSAIELVRTLPDYSLSS